ncbi:fibronectin type III domain-containing protein [Actinokineospora sp. PR83]|uniref:fibronectin type III domain-containing protein n=1 Tax=Actinokineospora sp. PR83 TaxID=2884908 RepID=UPI001F239194|nr:fibronectin type III domain-containing protein [Actinokineospora sp. PR83]MCG8918858.1 fibronectin type III domain-containing protein [Actinokineospora sp. PR83]
MRRTITLPVVAATIAASAALPAPAASAAPTQDPARVTAEHRCLSPLIGSATTALSDPVDPVTATQRTSPLRVEGTITVPAATFTAIGAATVEGSAVLDLITTGPSQAIRATLDLSLQKTAVSGNTVAIRVVGYTQYLGLSAPSGATSTLNVVAIDAVHLKLHPRRADGAPTSVREITSSCVRDSGPPVEWFRVDYPTAPDAGISAPSVQSARALPTSAQITWAPPDSFTPGTFAVTGYVIRVDGEPVLRLGPEARSATVPGLLEDTEYWIQVEAELDRGEAPMAYPTKIRTPRARLDVAYTASASVWFGKADTTVPLTGELKTTIDGFTGTFPDAITFGKSSFYTSGTRVDFSLQRSQQPAQGSYREGDFHIFAGYRMAISKVTRNGRAVPLAAGCGIDIGGLSFSPPPPDRFDPLAGGSVFAPFQVGASTECGQQADSLLTALLPGSINVLNVDLIRR